MKIYARNTLRGTPEKGGPRKESRSPPLKHTFSTEPSPESLQKRCLAS